eukprot:scaffold44113_cov22-Tisochrysis_lutea.AAC.1
MMQSSRLFFKKFQQSIPISTPFILLSPAGSSWWARPHLISLLFQYHLLTPSGKFILHPFAVLSLPLAPGPLGKIPPHLSATLLPPVCSFWARALLAASCRDV